MRKYYAVLKYVEILTNTVLQYYLFYIIYFSSFNHFIFLIYNCCIIYVFKVMGTTEVLYRVLKYDNCVQFDLHNPTPDEHATMTCLGMLHFEISRCI